MRKLNNYIKDGYDFTYRKYYENETFYIYDYTSPIGMTGRIVFLKTIDDDYNEQFPDLNDFGVNAWTIDDPKFLLKFLQERFNKTYKYNEDGELVEEYGDNQQDNI